MSLQLSRSPQIMDRLRVAVSGFRVVARKKEKTREITTTNNSVVEEHTSCGRTDNNQARDFKKKSCLW